MEDKKRQFGFFSIVLLGINSIIGSGIFLLPKNGYNIVGTFTPIIIVFCAVLVFLIALSFAEMGSRFDSNGSAYLYAKAAFGKFWGFEVGFTRALNVCIAWAAIAAGLVRAVSIYFPNLADSVISRVATAGIILVFGLYMLLGAKASERFNNIITILKLFPMLIVAFFGFFFIKWSNITPIIPAGLTTVSINSAILVLFYAFTGFESVAASASEMKNPKKNLPLALITAISIVTIIYFLLTLNTIGILGTQIATLDTPVVNAGGVMFGALGFNLMGAGVILSTFGINFAAAYSTPRNLQALAKDHILPKQLAKYDEKGAPTAAIIVSMVIAMLLGITGSFEILAGVSVIARFIQYIPTILAVLVMRKKDPEGAYYTIPFGPLIPVLAFLLSCYLLFFAGIWQTIQWVGLLIQGNIKTASQYFVQTPEITKILWGIGMLVVTAIIYYIQRLWQKRNHESAKG